MPTGSVTVRVPGKVNLHLGVGDLRADGFHEIVTVFHAVSLVDEVTVRTADLLSLQVVGEGAATLPVDRRNLAWQAAELMANHLGRAPTGDHHREGDSGGGRYGGRQRRRRCRAAGDEQPLGAGRPAARSSRVGGEAGERRSVRPSAALLWGRDGAMNWPPCWRATRSTGCWHSDGTGCPPAPCTESSTGFARRAIHRACQTPNHFSPR